MTSGHSGTKAAPPTWEVRLPERDKVPLGARKPRGTVVVWPGEPGEEHLQVPLAVAKSLLRKQKEGLEVGSRAELLYRIREYSAACARERLSRLLAHRDYSQAEAADKLRMDGYSSSCVEEVVGRAVEVGLVDDHRFAEAFMRTKVLSGWGIQRIERELSQRGVQASIVEGWPYDFVEEDEFERAYAIARTRSLFRRLNFASIARFLAARGFSGGVASQVARKIVAEAEAEAAEED